jgi:cell division protease FtsH
MERRSRWLLPLLAVFGVWAAQSFWARSAQPREISYSELLALLEDGKLTEAQLGAQKITATLQDGKSVRAERIPNLDERELVALLHGRGVKFSGHAERASWLDQFLLGWLLPLALMAGLWMWLSRRAGQGGPIAFSRSRAKVYADSGEAVTFADVAGVDEAVGELHEVVDFLRQPERYRKLGAHIPKGVLLVGPPGTGKTLLARAVAGEAQVPFFSITGSEFVEMFVGVGAARVRDLFARAKEKAPCIVFIDELDAVGRTRGGLGVMATHDEREQTLNQLLAEIDGFDPSRGVILMAATNRPEILDAALLRAGRFDRQILVDRPDLRGRGAILRVHLKKAPQTRTLDIELLARRTPGMAGADLANLVNEAQLAAARRGATAVEQRDFEEAIDRVQLGARKKSRIMTDEEKRRVAVHEAGHALVGLSLPHADPVHRVTIIPRATGALGATLQLPEQDRYLVTGEQLRDRLCVLAAGRAAELLVLGDLSTGAEDDLAKATMLARHMVCRFGMSERLGPRTVGQPGSRFLPETLQPDDDVSEKSARIIDDEIHQLLLEADRRARSLLQGRREALERLTARLIVDETVERDQLHELMEVTHHAHA